MSRPAVAPLVGVIPVCLAVSALCATETENLGIRALPPPGKVAVDGKFDDWDLSGGIFACGDAENQREKFAVWFHLMADADKLYLLARWNDETPLNHWGSSKGDYGFAGDCLQFRIITDSGVKDKERCSHWTCWRDREGIDVMDVAYGRQFNEGGMKDAQTAGAAQEFTVRPDQKGYAQEMAIPWKLLTRDGRALKTGESLIITIEPNFTIGQSGRLSIKDVFRPGSNIDRVFTFMASPCWGVAALEARGKVKPQTARLADAREFFVSLENGVPVVDWTGLIRQKELPGFKSVAFELPEDGHVSLAIRNPEGQVVRHLLNCAFFGKGRHEAKWDGLTTPYFRTPGQPVPAGDYSWDAIWHKGIGLRLRGFACNGGHVPWDSDATANWGGDHGVPSDCTTDGQKVYLGWTGAEAGKALVACNLKGEVQWKHIRGGIGGAQLIAIDSGQVFAQNDKTLYRIESAKGGYTEWQGTGSTDLVLKDVFDGAPERIDGLAAANGKLYLSYGPANTVAAISAATGKLEKRFAVPRPGRSTCTKDTLFVVSEGKSVVAVNLESGQTKTVVTGLASATGLAVDPKTGTVFVGTGAPDHQVKVFAADGKPAGQIGRPGGRPVVGPWVSDGLLSTAGMTVDAEGKLWVAEATESPKRISVWDTRETAGRGKLLMEFFGPTHYGASGGAILPDDPNIMVGEGCEWKLDPKTGRATCTGVFQSRIASFARFCQGDNGKRYLVTGSGLHEPPTYWLFERLGEGDYRFRGQIANDGKEKTSFWADANGDGEQQPEEVATLDGGLNSSGYCGWSFFVHSDLTVYGSLQSGGERKAVRVPVAGFTACNAPKYAVDRIESAPAVGFPSLDDKFLLEWTDRLVRCVRRADGKAMWAYPNTFSGVHGSHHATAPETGLLRGAFGVVGAAALSQTGALWALNGNCGEWYLFSERGYFISQLFQGDPMRFQFPEKAVPGAILDNCPPGLGGEDFGGSMAQGADGKVYVQAGKTGLWNVELVGLETLKALPGGAVSVTADDVKTAQKFREEQLQASEGTKRCTAKRAAPQFTGSLDADFKAVDKLTFRKQEGAQARVAMAWDETSVYLGWEVQDETPWVNGADAPEFMYARGDTVDLQLGTDPNADKSRSEAVKGDLRLSIGNFKGKPVAVVYRKVADEKHPKVFSSGVIKEYPMESVLVIENARIEVKVDAPGRKYVVEAALPLEALGLKVTDGLVLRGDFGVTHGDKTGADTAMRTHWNNQQTGMVNDEVFELKMEPRNWGEITFK
jgi:sugar lactone lactonase YvrE